MSEQFGNASNALTVDKYPCRVCGAAPGTPPGPESAKAFITMVRSAFSDIRVTEEESSPTATLWRSWGYGGALTMVRSSASKRPVDPARCEAWCCGESSRDNWPNSGLSSTTTHSSKQSRAIHSLRRSPQWVDAVASTGCLSSPGLMRADRQWRIRFP